jgi:hypothetical protein
VIPIVREIASLFLRQPKLIGEFIHDLSDSDFAFRRGDKHRQH